MALDVGAATAPQPGTLKHLPSAAGDISRPDWNDVRYVDPDEKGVSPWPTVELARVDAPPGGDDKTAELAVVILTKSGYAVALVHHRASGFCRFAPGVLAPVQVIVSWSINAYPTPSAPLTGTVRLRRRAAYTHCPRCAPDYGA